MTKGRRRPGRASASGVALAWLVAALLTGASACAPRVQIEAPEKPIVIQIKIEHEVRVKVDRELEDLFDENEELFGDSA